MRLFLASLILAALSVSAAPPSNEVRNEITALLSTLDTSGCRFNRNESWYSGADAKAHLLRKLNYLEKKAAVQSTEQFIELAATASSASGQAYQVKCGNREAVPSNAWLLSQL